MRHSDWFPDLPGDYPEDEDADMPTRQEMDAEARYEGGPATRLPDAVIEQLRAAAAHPASRFPDRPGAVYVATVLRGAAEVVVYPLLFGGGRLGIGPTGADFDGGMDRVWDYRTLQEAVDAAHAWNGNGEPTGYYRECVGGR